MFYLSAHVKKVGEFGSFNQMIWRQLPWFALVSIVVMWRWRREWLEQFRPALVLMAYMTVMYALTYSGLRYSLPLHPVLIVMVVIAYEALTRPQSLTLPASTPRAPIAPAPAHVQADPGFDPILSAMRPRN